MSEALYRTHHFGHEDEGNRAALTGKPMTTNQKQGFSEVADNAARALKQDLSKRLGKEIPSKQVEVGPDGLPPRKPPENSYLALDQAARQRQIGDQPPAGTEEQALDGSMAPPIAEAQPEQQSQAEGDFSQNVQRRFRELTSQLRDLERVKSELESRVAEESRTNKELASKFTAIQEEYDRVVRDNLDALDPETRARAMQDARIQELMQQSEQRIMSAIMPHVQALASANENQQMLSLAQKYPAFDIQIHGPLISMFRGKNPNCTVEQAYLAITEDENERITRGQAASQRSIPPIVQPSSTMNSPRYIPEPEPDPEAQMVEDARRIRELRMSTDPKDQREGERLAEWNLKQRLAERLGWDAPR